MDPQEISRLRERIAKRPAGEFHFPEVYGPDWNKLYIGDKVRFGRNFLEAVRAGRLPGVVDTGQKKDGGRIYRWRGN